MLVITVDLILIKNSQKALILKKNKARYIFSVILILSNLFLLIVSTDNSSRMTLLGLGEGGQMLLLSDNISFRIVYSCIHLF